MKFDLTKPETLMMNSSIDSELINNISERTLQKIFLHGAFLNVSDVAFQEGRPLMIKKNNLVFPINRMKLQKTTIAKLIGFISRAREGDDSAYDRVMQGEDSNFSYTFKMNLPGQPRRNVRYRVNCLRDGESAASIVCRRNNDEIFPLDKIGLSENHDIYKLMFPMKGLNLITGSVDSGKTTTIFSCLRHFIHNDKRAAFINTYENPIEADLRKEAVESAMQNKSVFQCPVPQGVKTFQAGIEQSLRRNADIILTGEVRTQSEVMGVVNGVLSTGKLIMATLHTDSVPVTINRLVRTLKTESEGETRSVIYDLISSLNLIVSQKLLTTTKLSRVAVHEYLYFDRDIKARLHSVEIDEISSEIEKIMKENGNTMVDQARALHENSVISDETFKEFELAFSY